jgi:hypothetical protein
MNQYKELTDAEVECYKNQLVLPNVIYPHYQPLFNHYRLKPVDCCGGLKPRNIAAEAA